MKVEHCAVEKGHAKERGAAGRVAAPRDKRKADGNGRIYGCCERKIENVCERQREKPARVIISRIAIRMDELYRRGLRCASNARCPPEGRSYRGIDTRSYAIINVSFALGIDRDLLYWQFIPRSLFSSSLSLLHGNLLLTPALLCR